jgi:hypothetical protein
MPTFRILLFWDVLLLGIIESANQQNNIIVETSNFRVATFLNLT